MCLAGGAVVASWSITQEVAEWQVWALLLTAIFVTEFSKFSENIQRKLK